MALVASMVVEDVSLPSWECGLKLLTYGMAHTRIMVTPFVGVWIEINKTVLSALSFSVTPFVGVWIEILCMIGNRLKMMSSLPSWECGLKLRKV